MSADRPFATRTLTAGASRLTLVPEAGGAIAAWRVGDQRMFYETDIAAAPEWDPLAMASFPLVPYSNRIGGGWYFATQTARVLGTGALTPEEGAALLAPAHAAARTPAAPPEVIA